MRELWRIVVRVLISDLKIWKRILANSGPSINLGPQHQAVTDSVEPRCSWIAHPLKPPFFWHGWKIQLEKYCFRNTVSELQCEKYSLKNTVSEIVYPLIGFQREQKTVKTKPGNQHLHTRIIIIQASSSSSSHCPDPALGRCLTAAKWWRPCPAWLHLPRQQSA